MKEMKKMKVVTAILKVKKDEQVTTPGAFSGRAHNKAATKKSKLTIIK